MREIKSHKVGAKNRKLRLRAHDDTESGQPIYYYIGEEGTEFTYIIDLEKITVESLLAIVEDRLSMINAAPYGKRETSIAITKIQEAMMFLQKPIRDIEMDSE